MSEKQQNKSQNSMDEPTESGSTNQPEQSRKNKKNERQSKKKENVSTVDASTPCTSTSALEDSAQQQGTAAGTENELTSNSKHSGKTCEAAAREDARHIKELKQKVKDSLIELHCGKLGQRELTALEDLSEIFGSGYHFFIDLFINDKKNAERCVQLIRLPLPEKEENETVNHYKERTKMVWNLRFESARVLCCITASNEEHIKCLLNTDAVQEFIGFLKFKNKLQFALVAVIALGNILVRVPSVRNFVISKNIVPLLVHLVYNETATPFLASAAFLIIHLCKPNTTNSPEENSIELFLPVVSKLLKMTDKTIQARACTILACLSAASNEMSDKAAEEVIKSGLVSRLVELLAGGDEKIIISCLPIVLHFGGCSETMAHRLIDARVFPTLTKILTHLRYLGIAEIVSKTVREFSQNISSAPQAFAAGLITLLVDVIKWGIPKARENAVFALMSIASKLEDHYCHLCNAKAILTLCEILKCKDLNIISTVLTAIRGTLACATQLGLFEIATRVIEQCGGLNLIKKLQTNNNQDIRKSALEITDMYFLK